MVRLQNTTIPVSATKGSACTNVTKLHQINERWFNNSFSGEYPVNDFSLSTDWYSTPYNGLTYRLADNSIQWDFGMCGTFYPIYLKDKHPNISHLNETPVSATVCVLDVNTPCEEKYEVKMRLCPGNDLQYFLGATLAYSAFCLDGTDLPYNASAIQPPNVSITKVSIAVWLEHKENDISSITWYTADTKFRCVFGIQNDLYYAVDWFVDGNLLRSVKSTNDTSSFILTEGTLVGAKLKCSVRVSRLPESLQTNAVYSPVFFAGAKIDQEVVFLPKKGQTEVRVKTTIPIGCNYNSRLGERECMLTLQITNENTNEKNCAKLVNLQYVAGDYQDYQSFSTTASCTKHIRVCEGICITDK
ncbi:hypothetical protein DPMN_157010 [Dreissena polymorpha]|uniref:Uncharacterized protein n=1 Tax=Dreissena polymorpha TaxID=45954 RepID=A0A9D4FUK0_DREPO|nr:hypothetical protein DPMN_157010 [Dreissena polymorpha]